MNGKYDNERSGKTGRNSGIDDADEFSGYNDYGNFNARFEYKYPTTSKTPAGKNARNAGGGGYPQNPQFYEKRKPSSQTGGPGGAGSSGGTNRPGKRRGMNAMFMAAIVGVGVLICLAMFWWVYSMMRPNPIRTGGETGAEIPVTENGGSSGLDTGGDTAGLLEVDSELAGAVREISSGTVTLINAADDSSVTIFINEETALSNKYGQAMTSSQFEEGDIVIVEYDSASKKAASMRLDPEAWTRASVKGLEISPGTESIKVGNDTLSVSKSALILPRGTEAMIKPSDVVTLKGRKTKIMAILVEKRSGTIEFKNKDKITDGTVEVNSDIYKALEEAGSIQVSTGSHTVVVKGANIDVFIKDVTVSEGETVVVDLSEAQVKEGVLNLTVNVADYAVSVNDVPVANISEPIKLPFGSYKIKVSKDGYTPWEGNVTVNNPDVRVTANLTEEVKMGRITVYTVPEGIPANVFIDNALIGTAPILRASVTHGTHQLTVKAEGYVDTSTPIIVEGDAVYNVTMHKLEDTGSSQGSDDTGANTFE